MFWNMILNAYNNMLAINKIRIIIERLHNVIVICMQYFFKYCNNILFLRTLLQYCSNVL